MNKKVSKKILRRDALIYTFATFLFYWLLNIVFVNLNFLDHNYQSKEDSDINDLVYSKFKRLESSKKKILKLFFDICWQRKTEKK